MVRWCLRSIGGVLEMSSQWKIFMWRPLWILHKYNIGLEFLAKLFKFFSLVIWMTQKRCNSKRNTLNIFYWDLTYAIIHPINMERINRVPKELGMKLLLLKAFCQLSVRKMVGLVSQKKCWCWAQGKLEEVKRRTRVCCIPRLWAAREAGTRPSICVLFLLPVYLSSSRTFLSLCPPFRAALRQGVEQSLWVWVCEFTLTSLSDIPFKSYLLLQSCSWNITVQEHECHYSWV